MSLSITCSGCEAVYPVGENLIGKTIRCKKCGEMMPVTAPAKPAKAAVIEDEDDEPRAKPSRRREEDEEDAPKSKMRRRQEEEDDEDAPAPKSRRRAAMDEDDDRPRRGGGNQQKSKLPMIIGGIVTLLLLGGGITAAVMFSGDGEDKDGKNNQQQVAQNNTNTTTPPNTATTTPPNTTTTTPPKTTTTPPSNTTSTPPTNTTTTTPKTTPTTTPPMTDTTTPQVDTKSPMPSSDPVRIGRGSTSSDGTSASNLTMDQIMGGLISELNMQKAKRAGVFIKAEADIGTGTGSGWFGIEPDLVFTNAHVLFMKAPNSPEPKKLTLYLNSGTAQQREIPHAKLKILAVDRDIDLAVIKIIGETNLPTPLKIRPSAELRDSQNVITIGFPLGYTISGVVGGSKKEPEVSTRRTSYSGSSADQYGQVRRIKLEGGINPGNSGGAIIDAHGDVVGVVVEMLGGARSGNFIGLGVPTEYVQGLIAGRVAEVEYGVPYRDGGKVKIPITAKVLNPLDRGLTINVRSWVADVSGKYRSPGIFTPKGEPGDSNEQVIELKYDAKTKSATGEMVYPDAPTGRTYWAQPFYTNAIHTYSLPGIKVPMNGPPVERTPANLVSNPKQGAKRALTMSNSSDLTEAAEGEGEAKNEKILFKTTLKVNETVVPADRTDQVQAAKLRLQFESINLGVEGYGGGLEQDILSKKNQEEINKFIKLAEAYGLINRFGEMYRYTVGIAGVNDPLFQFLVGSMTNEALEALQATSIPMPNKLVNAGETWTTTKDMRVTLLTGNTTIVPKSGGGNPTIRRPKPREYKYRDSVTYTYLGQRERGGKKEAVVLVEGKSIVAPGSKESVSGSVKGIAWVEIDTGVVVEAEIHKEFELDTSGDGVKKRLSGLNDYKLSRGSAQ